MTAAAQHKPDLGVASDDNGGSETYATEEIHDTRRQRDNSGSEISEGGGGGKASAVDQGRQRWSELGFAVAL